MREDQHRGVTPEDMLTVGDIAYLSGLSVRIVERLITMDLIQPARREPTPCFPPDVLARVRQIRRLHVQLGVSWSSMALVLELLDRIATLEAKLDQP